MAVSKQKQSFYEFGPFRIDLGNKLLLKEGKPVTLQPKMFDTLLVLVENNGRVIGKDELMSRIWPDTIVEEGNLTQNIYILRKVLGTTVIETVPKRGYRFSADVHEVRSEEADLILERQTVSHILIEEEADISDSRESTGEREETRTTEKSSGVVKEQKSSIETARDLYIPSGGLDVVATITRYKKTVVVAGLVAIIAITAGLFAIFRPNAKSIFSSGSATLFQTMRIAKLTTSGKVSDAAISPDGEYIVYSRKEAGQSSLWLRQTTLNSEAQIEPPAECIYSALSFARDGRLIYYVKREKGSMGTLYQMPLLGGAAKRLIEGIDGSVGFSPDGNRAAFIRDYPDQKEIALMAANLDGGEEQRLTTRKRPDSLSSPAWSPDGKTIAFGADEYLGFAGNLTTVVTGLDLESGTEKPFCTQKWSIAGPIVWLADGSGILMTATDQPKGNTQIWQITFPKGEAKRVSNDLHRYRSLSLTAASDSIAVVQAEEFGSVWIAPAVEANQAKEITLGSDRDGLAGLAWTPDGKVIYSSMASGNWDIWLMDPDGSNRKQLTVDAHDDIVASVSPDGRYIFFASDRAGAINLWRMESDGANPKQLTEGRAGQARCSPDSEWVVYSSENAGKLELWKIHVDGGTPVKLFGPAERPEISPDGKLIACFLHGQDSSSPPKIAIIPFAGGDPIKSFDVPPTFSRLAGIHWSRIGDNLTYAIDRDGVSNIWSQPLAGGPPKPLTSFQAGNIFRFDWSPDGRELLFVRHSTRSDVALVSDFK